MSGYGPLVEIIDILVEARQKVESARLIAEKTWGEKDPLTNELLRLWCDMDTGQEHFRQQLRKARGPIK